LREEKLESASVVFPAERLRGIVCEACEFYKPGEVLECAGFKILNFLIQMGSLTFEEVRFASRQACRKSSPEEVR